MGWGLNGHGLESLASVPYACEISVHGPVAEIQTALPLPGLALGVVQFQEQ